MKQALVDIEDSRFYEHKGVDVQGTVRALITNVASGTVREGGSTLTQQLVKQTLLQTATTRRAHRGTEQTAASVSRKLKEARLALALEQQYSKDEILTKYLNIVYFGEGAYGIEAAAHRYFSTPAAKLTLPQAAMLAGLVQSPSGDDPIANPENAMARRNQVLERMKTLGHITGQEAATSRPTQVKVKPRRLAAERLHRRRPGRVLLLLRARLPHRQARAHPEPARHRRPDDPDDARPGAAALVGPGRAEQRADGRPVRRGSRRCRARHRARAGDERQPPATAATARPASR